MGGTSVVDRGVQLSVGAGGLLMWVCNAVAGVCCSLATTSCCGVGLTVVPPVPPLKLTRVTLVLLITVLL